MQDFVIWTNTPYGLPLDIKLLPEYLNDQGYESHIVGKWHVGHHYKEYTPTFRGFSSHTGFWSGKEDYFKHSNDNGDIVGSLEKILKNI